MTVISAPNVRHTEVPEMYYDYFTLNPDDAFFMVTNHHAIQEAIQTERQEEHISRLLQEANRRYRIVSTIESVIALVVAVGLFFLAAAVSGAI